MAIFIIYRSDANNKFLLICENLQIFFNLSKRFKFSNSGNISLNISFKSVLTFNSKNFLNLKFCIILTILSLLKFFLFHSNSA